MMIGALPPPAHMLTYFQTVRGWHRPVEDDQIVFKGLEMTQGVGAVMDGIDDVIIKLEPFCQRADQTFIVISNQYLCH